MDMSARFWVKVERRRDDECWPWQAAIFPSGHGMFGAHLPNDTKRPHGAHRIAYLLTYGSIPTGMSIDHQCHNLDTTCVGGTTCPHRRCCNPSHLRAVPLALNKSAGRSRNAINARKTHCIRGHAFTKENTIMKRDGHRECRTCHNADQRRYRIERRERNQPAAVVEGRR